MVGCNSIFNISKQKSEIEREKKKVEANHGTLDCNLWSKFFGFVELSQPPLME